MKMSKLGRPLIKKAESTLEMALAQILHRILPLTKNKIPVAYNLIFFFFFFFFFAVVN